METGIYSAFARLVNVGYKVWVCTHDPTMVPDGRGRIFPTKARGHPWNYMC